MQKLCSLALAWLAGILSAGAAIWHVATNGVDNSDPGRGESWDLPYATISNAVNAAGNGDTVLVSNGTYAITAAIDVNKNLEIRGLDGNPSNVIVDAGGLCRGFFVSGTTNALLSGLTVQHGSNSLYGGGAYIVSTATVEHCIFQANRVYDSGGGIWVQYSTNLIRRCLILNNQSTGNGGGLYSANNSLVVEECRVQDNIAAGGGGGNGGGIYMTGSSNLVRNCLVYGNTAQNAGGMYVGNNTNLLENCTIVSNVALTNLSGVGGLWCNYHNYSHVINTIIYSNRSESVTSPYPNWRRTSSSVTFSNCCATPTLAAYGAGNITDDPAMTAPDAGNCRLLKGSPCINTGLVLDWMNAAADLDGHARLDRISRLVDMGCYEYAPPVTMFYSR